MTRDATLLKPSAVVDAMAVPDPRAEHWAEQIRTQLGKSVESILEVGRLLVKAKADLPHGEFGRLFSDDLLPFTASTAQRLMKVAEHPVLSNIAHVQHLPPSWGTLYELTKAEPATLQNALKDGTITPDMPRKAVTALLPPSSRPAGTSPAPVPPPTQPATLAREVPFGFQQAVEALSALIREETADWPGAARAAIPPVLRAWADIWEREFAAASRRTR